MSTQETDCNVNPDHIMLYWM